MRKAKIGYYQPDSLEGVNNNADNNDAVIFYHFLVVIKKAS
jgi:hypothetical protein